MRGAVFFFFAGRSRSLGLYSTTGLAGRGRGMRLSRAAYSGLPPVLLKGTEVVGQVQSVG